MYTLSHENDDDHHRDFLRTVEFLQGPEGSVAPLEESLREFRSALPRAVSEDETSASALARLSRNRDRVQSELLRVMTRTERRGRASGGDPMLEIAEAAVDLRVDDVEAYLGARQKLQPQVDAPGVMEYWKSTPYLLSFMDNYRLSDRLRATVERSNRTVRQPNWSVVEPVCRWTGGQWRSGETLVAATAGCEGCFRASRTGICSSSSGCHRRFHCTPWGGDFERARSSTKRLVFSSWTMVPRAIAAMTSYAAERRYVPDAERARRYEAQLLGIAPNSYSLFSLLTPSSALADAGDPLHYAPTDAPGLLNAVRERLRPEVEELTRDASVEGPPQEIWYSVAPLLLSRRVDRFTPLDSWPSRDWRRR